MNSKNLTLKNKLKEVTKLNEKLEEENAKLKSANRNLETQIKL